MMRQEWAFLPPEKEQPDLKNRPPEMAGPVDHVVALGTELAVGTAAQRISSK